MLVLQSGAIYWFIFIMKWTLAILSLDSDYIKGRVHN